MIFSLLLFCCVLSAGAKGGAKNGKMKGAAAVDDAFVGAVGDEAATTLSISPSPSPSPPSAASHAIMDGDVPPLIDSSTMLSSILWRTPVAQLFQRNRIGSQPLFTASAPSSIVDEVVVVTVAVASMERTRRIEQWSRWITTLRRKARWTGRVVTLTNLDLPANLTALSEIVKVSLDGHDDAADNGANKHSKRNLREMIRVDDDGRFDTEYRLDVEIDHALATHVKFRLFELVQGQFSLALLVDVGLMFGGAIETFLSVGRTMFDLEHDIELVALPQAPRVRGGIVSRNEPGAVSILTTILTKDPNDANLVSSSVLLLHRVRSVPTMERWRRSYYSAKFNHLDQSLFDGVLLKGVFVLVHNDASTPRAPFLRHIDAALLADEHLTPFLQCDLLDDDARTQLLTHTSARSSAVTTQQLADELSRRIQRLCNDLQLDAALCRWSTHANNATSKLSSVVALRHATTLAPSLARFPAPIEWAQRRLESSHLLGALMAGDAISLRFSKNQWLTLIDASMRLFDVAASMLVVGDIGLGESGVDVTTASEKLQLGRFAALLCALNWPPAAWNARDFALESLHEPADVAFKAPRVRLLWREATSTQRLLAGKLGIIIGLDWSSSHRRRRRSLYDASPELTALRASGAAIALFKSSDVDVDDLASTFSSADLREQWRNGSSHALLLAQLAKQTSPPPNAATDAFFQFYICFDRNDERLKRRVKSVVTLARRSMIARFKTTIIAVLLNRAEMMLDDVGLTEADKIDEAMALEGNATRHADSSVLRIYALHAAGASVN